MAVRECEPCGDGDLSAGDAAGAWSYDPRMPRGPVVHIVVSGATVSAHAGDNLAAALAVAGRLVLRRSPNAMGARGAFCLMGVCQECMAHVDGLPVMLCSERVRDGMVVELDLVASALHANRRAQQ